MTPYKLIPENVKKNKNISLELFQSFLSFQQTLWYAWNTEEEI